MTTTIITVNDSCYPFFSGMSSTAVWSSKQYFVSYERITFNQVKSHCESLNATFAKVSSNTDLIDVKAAMRESSITLAWIGLHKSHAFNIHHISLWLISQIPQFLRLSSSKAQITQLPFNFTELDLVQPNNPCIAVTSINSTIRLADSRCDIARKVLCQSCKKF